MSSRPRRLLVALACMLLLAACEAETSLQIDVDEDGGGLVTMELRLDPEAASRTVLFDDVPLDDLAEAGWSIRGPVVQPDGWYEIVATKPFSQPDQLQPVLTELAGPQGPLQGFELRRDKSFASRKWSLTGTIDLRGGLDALSDSELTALLGGKPLGYRSEDLAIAAAGKPLESIVDIQFEVDLPADLGEHDGEELETRRAGPATTVAADPAVDGSAGDAAAPTTATTPEPLSRQDTETVVVWKPSFADEAPLNLSIESSSTSIAPRLWRWGAMAAAVLGLAALAFQLGAAGLERAREHRRIRRRKARMQAGRVDLSPIRPQPMDISAATPVLDGPGGGDRPADGQEPQSSGLWAGAPSSSAAAGSSNQPGLRLLVVETAGVLFGAPDPVNDLLVPHVRARGSTLTASQIADWYVARVVGGLPAADFWMGLGIMGDPVLLDDAFARRYELTEEVQTFLHRARGRGLELAAVGEEVPEWIGVFRQRFGLDDLVGWWVCAAELGVRPPHPGLLHAVSRTTGIPAGQTMLIGRSVPMLDAARHQGMRTVHFSPDFASSSGGHTVLRTFGQIGAPAEPSEA